ncbi:MAG: hypothetical protein DHS20C14_12700 [Phycisphaeraceae bacterium]|nr:MAG: hypothetical protein DHS20C14_12700 [Phycisphaeraceae bacterium]
MTRFYESVLGFTVFRSSPDPEPTIVFMTIGPLPLPFGDAHPQMLVLIDPARHAFAEGRFDAPDWKTSTLNHLAFQIETADHEAEVARLTELGLEPRVVKFENVKSLAIFFRDPEGNTLELICHDPDAGDIPPP